MILHVLYRKWASIRLKHLKLWIATWQEAEMFAGIPGWGAQDAWMDTAMVLEDCQTAKDPAVLSLIAIMKCFDQLSRHLIYAIL